MVVMWRGDVPLGFASRKGAKREPPPGLEAVPPRAPIDSVFRPPPAWIVEGVGTKNRSLPGVGTERNGETLRHQAPGFVVGAGT